MTSEQIREALAVIDGFEPDRYYPHEVTKARRSIVEAARLYADLLENGCRELSPETRERCVLPATAEAHVAGHESAYVNNGRAVWDSSDAWWRVVPVSTTTPREDE